MQCWGDHSAPCQISGRKFPNVEKYNSSGAFFLKKCKAIQQESVHCGPLGMHRRDGVHRVSNFRGRGRNTLTHLTPSWSSPESACIRAVEPAMLAAYAKAGNVAGIRTSTDPEQHQPNVPTGKNFVSFHSLCQIWKARCQCQVRRKSRKRKPKAQANLRRRIDPNFCTGFSVQCANWSLTCTIYPNMYPLPSSAFDKGASKITLKVWVGQESRECLNNSLYRSISCLAEFWANRVSALSASACTIGTRTPTGTNQHILVLVPSSPKF